MLTFHKNIVRPGQVRVITDAVRRLAAREPWTTFVLPTGYGKSDVFRCVAYEAWARKEAACTLLVAPNCFLADQLLEDDEVRAWTRRYSINDPIRKRVITRPGVDYAANGEIMLSVNIQLVRTGAFDEWVAWMGRHGRVVNVGVDETTSYADTNQWGVWIERLQRAGAAILLGTAFPRRTDGESLLGWTNKRLKSTEPYRFTRTREGETPETLIVDLYEGVEREYELIPDIAAVSFEQAWKENALCRVSTPGFDVELETHRDGDAEPRRRWLSELPESEVRRRLDQIVREPTVIEIGVQKMVQALGDMRRANPGTGRAAAIVFSANDRTGERNGHARHIEREIRRQAPELRVLIVTMVSDDDFDEDAVTKLRGFSRDTSEYDILIVKQMGAIGLNAPRLKVALDLSPQRAEGPYIQRVNRTTRPWAGIYHSVLVMPADRLATALFEKWIAAQGGAYEREAELVDSYETTRVEQAPEFTEIVGTQDWIVTDTDRNWIPYDKMVLAVRLLEELPALIASYSYPELGLAGERLFGPAPADPDDVPEPSADITDTGRELERMRRMASKRVKLCARRDFVTKFGRRYQGGGDSEAYGQIVILLWGRAKTRAGLAMGMAVEDIQNLEEMRRLLQATERL